MVNKQRQKHKVKVLSVNITTVRGKRAELQNLIEEVGCEVVCLQETRMKGKLALDDMYEVNSVPAGTRNRGNRGNKILVKKYFTSLPTNLNEYCVDGVELAGADIALPIQKPIRVVSIYISASINNRNKTKRDEVIETIISAANVGHPVFLTGDPNCKLPIPQHDSANPLGECLQEKIRAGELVALYPADYTRYDYSGRAPSVLDIVIMAPKYAHMVENLRVHHDIGSDHRPISFEIIVDSVPLPTRAPPKPDFEKANWRIYQGEMKQKMFGAPQINPSKESIDAAVEYITAAIKDADQAAIPRIRWKDGRHRRRLPPEIICKIKQKRKLRNRLQKKGEIQLKPLINQVNREIQEEIKIFEEKQRKLIWEQANDKSQYGFYKVARKLLHNKEQISTYPIKDPAGKTLNSDEAKAKEFKRVYEDIYTTPASQSQIFTTTDKEAENYREELSKKYAEVKLRKHELLNTSIAPSMIIRALTRRRNTAPGEDGVYYHHIKNLPASALQYIADLYSTAWKCSYFPDVWKTGVVTLLHKLGKDLTNPRHYRPITLLGALGKTMELLINPELMRFYEVNGVLPESQAGFRHNRSTQDQLFKIVQDVTNGFKANQVTLAAMFDIEKAYDKMWHNGALLKLRKTGLDEPTVALLMNYLSGRKIKLRVNHVLSDPVELNCGTPQGAILSPTIFQAWVHDIPQPQDENTRLSQFADDIATWATHERPSIANRLLQEYNNKLIKWCKTWRIMLSHKKTKFVGFYRKNIKDPNKICQNIDNHKILMTDQVEFLGIILDKRLTLKYHHQKIMTELRRRTGIFASITGTNIKPRADSEISMKIFESMILPVAYYSTAVTCLRTDRQFTEQDAQIRKAARLALHAPKSVRSAYVEEKARLANSKSRTAKLANSYILKEERSPSVKSRIAGIVQPALNPCVISPLDIILSI